MVIFRFFWFREFTDPFHFVGIEGLDVLTGAGDRDTGEQLEEIGAEFR